MQASFRWNDNEEIDADRQPYRLNSCRPVIPACLQQAGRNDGQGNGRLLVVLLTICHTAACCLSARDRHKRK